MEGLQVVQATWRGGLPWRVEMRWEECCRKEKSEKSKREDECHREWNMQGGEDS